MKYKNIIFDLDGTLLDTSDGIKQAVQHTIRKMGYKNLSNEELQSFIGPPIQNSLISAFGCSVDDAQKGADVFRNYYKNISLFNAKPYAKIYDLMEEIINHEMDIAVATYKREDYAIKLLNKFRFNEYCKVMHGADNFNRLTKADIIKKCIDELDGDKENSLYVGDTKGDFIGASLCGINFIGVEYGFGFSPEQKYEFETINEPLELLNYIAVLPAIISA